MRDYPSVPNVFRVASTLSVNNEDNYQLPAAAAAATMAADHKVSTAAVATSNADQQKQQTILKSGHFKQQQQQQQPQKQYSTEQVVATTSVNATTNATKTAEFAQKQQQQPTQVPKLPLPLSSTSTERSFLNGDIHHGYNRVRVQYSPYGTLPRFDATLTNGGVFQSPPPSQRLSHQPQPNNINGSETAVASVINTVSGSIPSTSVEPSRTATAAVAKRNGFNGHARHDSRADLLEKTHTHGLRSERNITSSGGGGGGGYLWILTPVAASISVAIVIAALAGPQWLFTEEKLPNANYNGTANFNVLDDGAFITKYTKSSLWILCTTIQGVETYHCIKIDYFPQEGYQPDPHDSTPAIPYTVTKSCPFFLAAGLFLLISFIIFLIPTCSQQNSLYYFSAGIMFIVSGLLMLIGLIAYISILKAEIGSKLRPRSTLQPALFKVTYGQSFFLFVFGFIATEFVGLLNIFLYISLQEVSYYSRLPCFTITNLQEKIKEGASAHNHSYKSYKYDFNGEQKPVAISRRVHDTRLPVPRSLEGPVDGGNQLLQQAPGYACRKHPNAGLHNYMLDDSFERRYYFERPPTMPKCNLHSKNLAKSLNELYTDPAILLGPPPPPSAIRVGQSRTLPRLQLQQNQHMAHFGELPQEFPLTRSVSTTTDIYTNGNNNSRTVTPRVERRNVRNMATNTSNTRSNGIEDVEKNDKQKVVRGCTVDDAYEFDIDEEPHRLCGLKRGVRKTKDELFQEFCKRAGMRPKPKNIYYITNDDEHDDEPELAEKPTVNTLKMNGMESRAAEVLPRAIDDSSVECKQILLQDDDEHIYVVDDNPPYLLANPLRNMRRASMYAEPMHLRKLSSDLSLHTLYPPASLFGLEKCDYSKNAFGGSHDRLGQELNTHLHGSRTLPRSFAKRNTDSLDSLGSASLQASTHALQSAYSVSKRKLNDLLLQHQQQQQQYQQQQQQNRYLSASRDGGLYHSALTLNKPNDYNYLQPPRGISRDHQHQHQQQQQQQHQQIPMPNNTLKPTAVQWPAVIPSSPSNYTPRYQLYAPATNAPYATHNMLTRSTSGGGSGAVNGNGNAGVAANMPKFQRGYAFDEQRRSSSIITDTFDLDEIERERRRSHASLFSGTSLSTLGGIAGGGGNSSFEHYDLVNGTAV